MIWFLFQFGFASLSLMFSTVVVWYEGSAILDNRSEWRHTTPFTQLLYGEVVKSSDISRLDHFVYAAKFQHTFSIIMVLSSLYLLVLLGYFIFKQETKGLAYYFFFLGGGLLLFSSFISKSSTVGGQIFFSLFLITGLICIITSLLIYFQILNRVRMRIAN